MSMEAVTLVQGVQRSERKHRARSGLECVSPCHEIQHHMFIYIGMIEETYQFRINGPLLCNFSNTFIDAVGRTKADCSSINHPNKR